MIKLPAVDEDVIFPLASLFCGTVVICVSIVFVDGELAIAGVTAGGGLYGVSGTAYQAKVKAEQNKPKPRATRRTTKTP